MIMNIIRVDRKQKGMILMKKRITAIVAIGLTIAIYNSVVSEWTSNIQLSLAVVCIAELSYNCEFNFLNT